MAWNSAYRGWNKFRALVGHQPGRQRLVRLGSGPGTADQERVMRAFARTIQQLTDYTSGREMRTSETSLAYKHDEIGRTVGVSSVIGGHVRMDARAHEVRAVVLGLPDRRVMSASATAPVSDHRSGAVERFELAAAQGLHLICGWAGA